MLNPPQLLKVLFYKLNPKPNQTLLLDNNFKLNSDLLLKAHVSKVATATWKVITTLSQLQFFQAALSPHTQTQLHHLTWIKLFFKLTTLMIPLKELELLLLKCKLKWTLLLPRLIKRELSNKLNMRPPSTTTTQLLNFKDL